MLKDLQIQNFRCFDDLHIERLGRVNLIVGKNGVGKSTVIEALQVYQRRDEHRYPFRKAHFSLFHRWHDREDEIRIGSGAEAIQVGVILVPPGLDPERQEPKFQVSGGASNRSLTVERQAELWDEAALSALEDDVIASLQLVMPEIDRISLIGGKTDASRA